MTFFGTGILQWQPAFLIRSYGLKTGELDTWFAVIYGLGGMLGTYCGGELASRLAMNNERLQLKAMAALYSAFAALSAFIYIAPNYYWALGLMALAAIAGATTNGPLFAIIQTLVPDRMRAVAVATIYLFANLVGVGLGPLVAGALSDGLRPLVGEESLRYALLALCPGYLWGGWHLWQASKTVSRDLHAVLDAQLEATASNALGVSNSLRHFASLNDPGRSICRIILLTHAKRRRFLFQQAKKNPAGRGVLSPACVEECFRFYPALHGIDGCTTSFQDPRFISIPLACLLPSRGQQRPSWLL